MERSLTLFILLQTGIIGFLVRGACNDYFVFTSNSKLTLLSFLSQAEQKIAGSVPLLEGVVPPYAGEPMAPF
jgi:hypothetical protein